jgi:zinc transport system substrate-binding protein
MKQLHSLFYALCLFTLCLVTVGCSGVQKHPEPSKPLLLVSLPPYKTLVEQIAGDEFAVVAVVPLNADPHTYEPTSKQLSQLTKGKIWFRIGESFEAKLLPLLKARSVDLREGVSMIEEGGCHCHGHSTQDRHIWLSPNMLSVQAAAISAELSKQFPEKKEEFAQRLTLLQKSLSALDLQIAVKMQLTKERAFIVSHPAFAYFCRDYHCQQLSVEYEGKEPRPKEVEALLHSAIERETRIAISLPQHNNKGAQLIAGKLDIPIRMIDPYAADYAETMLKLASLIANPYQTNE